MVRGVIDGMPRLVPDGALCQNLDFRIAVSIQVFWMPAKKPVSVDDARQIVVGFPVTQTLVQVLGAISARTKGCRHEVENSILGQQSGASPRGPRPAGPEVEEDIVIFTVAIDGPAAAGKGTIARALAARFGFEYLDTGLLYRATARKVIDGMDPVAAAHALTAHDFQRNGLRTAKVGQMASKIAALPPVRAALIAFQQKFAATDGGAVLDGRDIGTVICPQAQVKLYVTASPEVRAHRRWLELGGDEAAVLAEVLERDKRDMGRAVAPLKPAADALVLDTSVMSIDAAVQAAVDVVLARMGSK